MNTLEKDIMMTDNASAKALNEALLLLLDETFENVKGIYLDRGTSLFETLATITAEEASQPVSANCASIAAHVEHISFHMDTLLKFLNGERPQVDWTEIWRTVEAVSDEEWQANQSKLRETYQRVCEHIKTIDIWHNAQEIAGAMGLIAHNAYHLGEIRQALCTIRVTE